MNLRHASIFALAALLNSVSLNAADGSLDTAWGSGGVKLFNAGGEHFSQSAVLAALPSGKLLLAGSCDNADGLFWICAASLLANGDFDSSFGPTSNGRVRFDVFPNFPRSTISAVAVTRDGRAVLVGNSSLGGIVAILKPDGTLDTSVGSHRGWVAFNFDSAASNPSSYVSSVAVQPDGKIIVAGSDDMGSGNFAVARLLPNLGFDTTFGNAGVKSIGFDLGTTSDNEFDQAYAVALQPNGFIVLGGVAYGDVGYKGALVRLNTLGQIDTTFGSTGKALQDWGDHTTIISIAVARDGGIVASGYSANVGSKTQFAANRLLPDGSQDPTFLPCSPLLPPFCVAGPAFIQISSTPGANDYANALTLQSDGKILIAGATGIGSGTSQFAVVRLAQDGTLDPSFGSAGKRIASFGTPANSVYAIGATHGGIFVSGEGGAANGSSFLFGLAKLKIDLIFSDEFDW